MQQLLDNPDPEIKIIGLIIETYDASTGEPACLLRRELKLKIQRPTL